MKKKLMAVLAFAMVLVTVGCGATKSSAPKETWQSASVGYSDSEYSAEYYVQFSESEITYGHMTDDGDFVSDYSDKVSSYEETAPGYYTIKAESSNGTKYTYKTCEDDTTILEYYGSWNENEFADTYSGSASLTKM